MPFVSDPIDQETISKFCEPRLLIPIYSHTSMTRYPFLLKHRVGIGRAVLTRAQLFIDLPEMKAGTAVRLSIQKKQLPISLQSNVETEAKYLSLAFATGVLREGLAIERDSSISLGLFGKMYLGHAEISLVDDSGKDYSLSLSNVQFDLDLSIETETYIYLIEAKMGKPKTFSALQLFYPLTLMRNAVFEHSKRIHTVLATISKESDSVFSYAFHKYIFKSPKVANSSEFISSNTVELALA